MNEYTGFYVLEDNGENISTWPARNATFAELIEFLIEEGAETIMWCEEHRSLPWIEAVSGVCQKRRNGVSQNMTPCRMVKKLLCTIPESVAII